MYEVKTLAFSGPLEKLLELIEARQLEITNLSLAEVTADFFNYVKSLENKIDTAILADFIVVASKLLLIKSKALLPNLELTKEEESDIQDLEKRLKIYKEFKESSKLLASVWEPYPQMSGHQLFFSIKEQEIFFPPPSISPEHLFESLSKLVKNLKELIPETAKVKTSIISLEGKIQELMNRFQETVSHSFQNLSKEKNRTEIVVLFLAVLHLLKDKLIHVEQTSQFGDILLKKTDGTQSDSQN